MFPGNCYRAVLTVLLVMLPISLQGEIHHSGNSDATQLASCAEAILHRRVFVHPNLPFKGLASLCANQSKDAFVAALNAHSVVIKEDDNWAYLISSTYFGPWPSYALESEKLHWKSLKVEVSIANADPKLNQTQEQLKPEILQKLKEQVIQQARLVPVFEPHTQSGNETAKVIFNLTAYLRHTRKDGPASLLVVLREGEDSSVGGRIIYGEQQADGSYQLLWDSPVIIARYMDLRFFDVDGDGTEEIVLRSAYPAGVHDLGSFSVFDIRGKELTRQTPCAVPALFGFSAADGVCPVVGESVDFDYNNGPPYDIYVNKSLADGEDIILKLQAGHYIDPSSIRKPRRNKPEAKP